MEILREELERTASIANYETQNQPIPDEKELKRRGPMFLANSMIRCRDRGSEVKGLNLSCWSGNF